MSTAPLVSICIPSYNHARYLPATLDSALAQTYPNIEIIVLDDGSKDDSLKIAADYEARFPDRVKVYTHANGANRGISQTVNAAFAHSRGKYWMGLPSDDILYPDKIEKQVAFLEKNPELGFVYCYVDYIDSEGKPASGSFGRDITADPDPLKSMILENFIPGMAILARREAIARVGDHDAELIYSDWDFWVRLFSMYKGGFIPESLIGYRVHDYNTSVGTPRATQIGHIRDFYLKLLEHVDNGLIDKSYRKIIEHQIENLPAREASWLMIDCYEALDNGRRRAAYQTLKMALQVSPRFVLNGQRVGMVLKKTLLSLIPRSKMKQN
ncbi:MAG TPA: glycosyltransferase [Pyrinomonadaceae bacterium]|jgi:glycosyltransferase involved in cell wall biosynthesis